MLNYKVKCCRTTGFWLFKKDATFFYYIMASKSNPKTLPYLPHWPYDYTAVVYNKSYRAPELKYKTYTTTMIGDTETDAFNGLVRLIEKQTKSIVVDMIQL